MFLNAPCQVGLNQTTRDWHTRVVTLSETKGLSERFFALLRMTHPKGCYVKCTNVLCFDLVNEMTGISLSPFQRKLNLAGKKRDVGQVPDRELRQRDHSIETG